MNKDSKILLVGHNGVIEDSLYSYFRSNGFSSVVSSSAIGLDPAIQPSVYDFFQTQRPEYVFLASTRSGGIEVNRQRGAEFIYHNLESQNNIVYASWKFGVKKLLYIAGSCVYPKECPQPMRAESLLTGSLESTSEPYSIAKIAGIKLCQAFRRQYQFNTIVMAPATVYGPGSDTDIQTAHVLGALIAKFAQAIEDRQEEVVLWGSGRPRREFIYADDFVDSCLFLMKHYDGDELINAGTGCDIAIKDLAEKIATVAGFKGKIIFDDTKPDGAMTKLLDSTRIHGLGWKAGVSLEQGIAKTYQWYISQKNKVKV